MQLFLSFFLALMFCAALVPPLMRMAVHLKIVDTPDERKVHSGLIPRVGGIAMVVGTLVPVLLLTSYDSRIISFVIGSLIILLFGVIDDRGDLDYRIKFLGQILAALVVVVYGGIRIDFMPFYGFDQVSLAFSIPFTVLVLVGVTNAINLADGLDGLAAGIALLSFFGLGVLALTAEESRSLIILVAIIGSIFGFLRFNTYPAHVFMGDTGSQFLGFSAIVLAVIVTQQENTALSPVLPLLLLGLPILDTIYVMVKRIMMGVSPFKPDKRHIHHRLLGLGFHHYESVMILYSVQAVLVMCAILMPYESDNLLLALYFSIVAVLFILIAFAENNCWCVHKGAGEVFLDGLIDTVRRTGYLAAVSSGVILYGISLYMVVGPFVTTQVPVDFTIAALTFFVFMLLRLLLGARLQIIPIRLLVYGAIAFIVYLTNTYQPEYMVGVDPVSYIYFGVLVASMALSIRYANRDLFSVTTMDYLVILAVLVLSVLTNNDVVDTGITAIVLKTLVLFYGSEILLTKMENRWNIFTVSVLFSLLVISARGLMSASV